jgi:hypothetical protein
MDGVVKNIIKNTNIYAKYVFRDYKSSFYGTYDVNNDYPKPMTSFTHWNIFPRKRNLIKNIVGILLLFEFANLRLIKF